PNGEPASPDVLIDVIHPVVFEAITASSIKKCALRRLPFLPCPILISDGTIEREWIGSRTSMLRTRRHLDGGKTCSTFQAGIVETLHTRSYEDFFHLCQQISVGLKAAAIITPL